MKVQRKCVYPSCPAIATHALEYIEDSTLYLCGRCADGLVGFAKRAGNDLPERSLRCMEPEEWYVEVEDDESPAV